VQSPCFAERAAAAVAANCLGCLGGRLGYAAWGRVCRVCRWEEKLDRRTTSALRLGVASGLAFALGAASAAAQQPSWIEPKLLDAAKKEGTLVVYSSTNEREGLALFKLFEAATGIKVQYVRGADNVLSSRMAIEFRGGKSSFDVVHMTATNRLPPQILAQYEPPEARHIPADAKDPNRRWYGVYAVYNTPAYNTKLVKPDEVPKSYEELAQRKQWKGRTAIDGTDAEWLRGLTVHYGEKKGLQIARDIAANLNPVLTVGHLALSRSVGSGEYALSINNYTNLDVNVKLGKGAIEVFALDPVTQFFGTVGVNSKAPHPNAARLAANFMLSRELQQFYTKFGRPPTRSDVKANPADVYENIRKRKIVTALMTAADDKKWSRLFDDIFKRR
jgi:iron(III) transport system substrate-binding protein